MPEVRFKCPRCQATVKFSHTSPQGKRVRCPKCLTVSSVRLPQLRPAAPKATRLVNIGDLSLDDPAPMTPPPRTAPHKPAVPAAKAAPKPPSAPPRIATPKKAPVLIEEPPELVEEIEELEDVGTLMPAKAAHRKASPIEEPMEMVEPADEVEEEPRPKPAPKKKKGYDPVPLIVLIVMALYAAAVVAAWQGRFDGDLASTSLPSPPQRKGENREGVKDEAEARAVAGWDNDASQERQRPEDFGR